jgi:D-alanyl-D-alanine carboxypeptidase
MRIRCINRIFIIIFCLASFLAIKPLSAAKYAAYVMDAQTGQVFHAENAYGRVHPASLTKIATLYMLFEALNQGKVKLDTKLKISAHAARQIPTKLGIPAGSIINVKDAILALVTKSANDVAVAVAEHLSGSEAAFSQQMTKKVHQLGLKSTLFKNASGVPNKQQITTAADMAKLLQIVIRDFPGYYKRYFGQKTFNYKGVVHINHNKLLGKVEGLDGGKTGFVCASGFNISTSTVRNGKRLIVVVMGGATSKWRDQRVTLLTNKGFDTFKKRSLDPEFIDQNDLHELPNPRMAAALSANPEMRQSDELYPQGLPQAKRINYSRSKQNIKSSPVNDTLKNAPAIRAQQRTVKEENQDEWGVQIGSFRDANQAHMTAAHLLAKLPEDIEGQVSITRANRKQGHPYRARLVGFSKEAAQRVCYLIEKEGTPCLPFQKYRQEKMYTAMNVR